VSPDGVPHLVTVPSPQQDISRSHVEIQIEGSHVIARDLDTTNGTMLRRPGQPPLRLTVSDSVLAISGDVLDLGDGITVTFRDIP
jgi:pSer/pThr/pTyr-binding forkhead associated (FHA) protein